MPEKRTFTCDVCGREKTQLNDWWIIVHFAGDERDGQRPAIQSAFACLSFNEEAWNEIKKTPGFDGVALACGEKHAHELFSRWLIGRDFRAPHERAVSSTKPKAANGSQFSLAEEPSRKDSHA